jgi:hypothetical protein
VAIGLSLWRRAAGRDGAGEGGPPARSPVTRAAVRALYRRPPSFTDLLPWVEYLPESRSFLLEDGVSVGALFELEPVGTEARTPALMCTIPGAHRSGALRASRFAPGEMVLRELRDAVQTALTEAIPELDEAPWVLQLYVQDEPSLAWLERALAAYAEPRAQDSAFSRHFQAVMARHLAAISRPGGLFEDAAGRAPAGGARCAGCGRPSTGA